jgi:hypothetical protein
MHALRPALALALAGLAATAGLSSAADAPKSGATSKTLYLAQEGCGTTAVAGRLEIKPQSDGADGCGTIGGVPVNEVLYQGGGDEGEDYTSTKKLLPFVVDGAKKVTGQVAAMSWVGVGGVGVVDWDITLSGTTKAGKSVLFGSTTATTTAAGADEVVMAPFSIAVPAAAKGQTFRSFVLTVFQHGANVGYSAKKLSGDSYVVIPAKRR